MGVRKSVASLTPMEKQRFVAAVLQLKATGVYDTYVTTHMNAMMYAHRCPAFLPWHRELLRRYELALQGIDSSVTLPYWDWTVDNTPASAPWTSDMLGGNGRAGDLQVMDGAFAFSGGKWTLNVDTPPNFLTRQFGASAASLPTAAEVATVLAVTPYDSAPWNTTPTASFRNQLEGWVGPNIHNRVHLWVGGAMLPMSSPNDPVFFLHHCNIDRLWAQWQAMHPTEGYQPVTGAAPGQNLNDPMQPWGAPTTIAGVLDHRALGYTYDTEKVKVEKLEVKEHKFEKLEKVEVKEHKLEKIEIKEHKLEKVEVKEHKLEKVEKFEKVEIKEHKLEKVELPEKLPWEGRPPFPGPGPGPDPAIEQRLSGVEQAVAQLSHFITPGLRPDLSQGALGTSKPGG